MDIVSRLKYFLDSQQIPNSLFADKCGIPRPTLSQLLNGRNKRISDEVISKIHLAYPSLNILWLMFGEGLPMSNSNIEMSVPQNEAFRLSHDEQRPKSEQNTIDNDSLSEDTNLQSNKLKNDSFGQAEKFPPQFPSIFDQYQSTASGTPQSIPNEIKLATDSSKQITNIVVFYSDNSFQSFNPA